MKNCEKSQILMLSLVAILLVVTPLLSSSLRTTYMYFITNLLIIALGAQAGIFKAFSKAIDHEKKNPVSVPQKHIFVVPILMLSLVAILLVVTPLLSSSLRTTYMYFITNLLIIALGAQAGIFKAFSKAIDHEKKNPVSVPQKHIFVVPSELASAEKRVAAKVDEDQRVAAKNAEDQRIAAKNNEDRRVAAKNNEDQRVAAKNNEDQRVAAKNDEAQRVASGYFSKNGASKLVAQSKSLKATGNVKMASVMKKCPSMPSLFFIGGGETETENERDYYDDSDEEVEELHPIEEEEELADLSGQELLIKAETFIGNFYKQLKMQREDSWKKIHGMFTKPSAIY